jgi:phosphoribosylformylglycinamidine synthase
VYLVGGSTGRDGIQGASFASRTLTEKSDSERSAVQVPDPFTKKLIIEAVLEAVDADIVQGMKDLGGGGLTCGLSEMAAKAGMGMEINLDNVRTREPSMRPAEIMISESQERMLIVVQSKNEEKLTRILDKWELG